MVRWQHRWDDDEERPEPDLTDPATAAALTRAARDVRIVKLLHLALLVLGLGLLALAPLLMGTDPHRRARVDLKTLRRAPRRRHGVDRVNRPPSWSTRVRVER
jgi:hypothetical protein